ncbi:protein phosphatase 1L-like [Stegodyphus dumicola]|uniref:protein phosphatase 1L-like n=1 Tax=Stegodyphus dumicola TaxID=202533 RepID=UPI0015B01479|nr:protein phosphatase 1L-like [Stegodyphus dumicola]
MEEDSEDVAVYQAILKNLKILSRVFWSFPLTSLSKYISGTNYITTSKLEISLTIFALFSFVLILYHCCELLRRFLRKFYPVRLRKLLLINSADLLKDRDSWEFINENCGVYAIKGRRPRMEDRFSVISDKESGISMYGIFDGHGGDFAAEFVEKHLFKELLKKLQAVVKKEVKKEPYNLTNEFVELLTKGILDVDLELLVKVKASRDVAGTTALVAVVYKNKLIVANVGDSRGVICDSKGNTVPLSFDHKPDQLKERRRIREAGGFISFNGVWRVAGILATSRALGDFPLKDRNLVIARPDILTFDLADLNPQFMILATDGLWDTFSNEDAVAFVKDHIQSDLYKGARSLALQAHKNGSMDNITVLVASFSNITSS